ncbi:MAG: FAD-dependent 5-carboxymethylaminomethyl-2-thiouridine(34) oxidoreductase MnmC [Myxococcota bacterium]
MPPTQQKHPGPRFQNGQLIHPGYDDVYFNPKDGRAESIHVFMGGNRIGERLRALSPGDRFTVAEAGFGVGRNFLVTLDLFLQLAPADVRLVYHSFESQPVPFALAEQAIAPWRSLSRLLRPLKSSWPLAIPGCAPVFTGHPNVQLFVWVGDIRDRLPETRFSADAWYLDGFSPSRNPAMWSADVFEAVGARSQPGTTAATYSAAGDVRRGLKAAGFSVQLTPGFGGKLHMISATATQPRGRIFEPDRRYPIPSFHDPGRVAVVGAGIAGSSLARGLAEAGLHVVVFDANGVASGASGNPYGLTQPLPNLEDSPVGDWYSRAFSWTRGLAAQHGLPWDIVGVTRYPASQKKRAYALRLLQELSWKGVLDEPTAPGACLDIHHAAMVKPVAWCHALLDHERITVHPHRTVTRLTRTAAGWRLFGDRDVYLGGFETVVLANSAAARQLVPWLPLRWVRGQLGWVKQTPISAAQTRALCHEGYLLPARDGVHIIGATYHREDMNPTWRDADWAALLDKLSNNIPQAYDPLKDAERSGGRVAFRGVTPGRLPFVGPVPSLDAVCAAWDVHGGGERPYFDPSSYLPGLWCSVGHGSRGLISGPFAAAIGVAQILGQPAPVSGRLLEMIHPARAAVRIAKGKTVYR